MRRTAARRIHVVRRIVYEPASYTYLDPHDLACILLACTSPTAPYVSPISRLPVGRAVSPVDNFSSAPRRLTCRSHMQRELSLLWTIFQDTSPVQALSR